MKKFFMVAMALCLVFCMAQVTVADDRLKINGEIRVRGFNVDNTDGDADADDNSKYIDSRFRLGMVVTVAEGITANLRGDYEDDVKWGVDQGAFGRPTPGGATLELDRMFIRIEKDMFNLVVGHQFVAFGNGGYFTAWAPQTNGISLRLKTPVVVDLQYFKLDEGSSTIDEEDDQKDVDAYGLQASYKADAFQAGAYYGAQMDGKDTEDNPSVIGLWGNSKVGPVKVTAALDMFGGSNKTSGTEIDYIGTQFWAQGEMKATDMVTAGLNFYYAVGTTEDNETQIVTMPGAQLKFGGFEPMEILNYYRQGDNLAPLRAGSPYDPSGDSAGVMGFDAYGLFQVTDTVKLGAQLGYFSPTEDDATVWESSMLIQGAAGWTFAPKCELVGAFYHRTDDTEDDSREDAELGMVGILRVMW